MISHQPAPHSQQTSVSVEPSRFAFRYRYMEPPLVFSYPSTDSLTTNVVPTNHSAAPTTSTFFRNAPMTYVIPKYSTAGDSTDVLVPTYHSAAPTTSTFFRNSQMTSVVPKYSTAGDSTDVLVPTYHSAALTTSTFFRNAPMTYVVPKYSTAGDSTDVFVPTYHSAALTTSTFFRNSQMTSVVPEYPSAGDSTIFLVPTYHSAAPMTSVVPKYSTTGDSTNSLVPTCHSATPDTSTFFEALRNASMTSVVPEYPSIPSTALLVPRYYNPASAFAPPPAVQELPTNQRFGFSQSGAAIGFCDGQLTENSFYSTTEREAMNTNHADAFTSAVEALSSYITLPIYPSTARFNTPQSTNGVSQELDENFVASSVEDDIEAIITNRADTSTITDEAPSTYSADVPTPYTPIYPSTAPTTSLSSNFPAPSVAQGIPTNQIFGFPQSRAVIGASQEANKNSFYSTTDHHCTASKATDVVNKYPPFALIYPTTLSTPVPSTARFDSPQSRAAIGSPYDSSIESVQAMGCITVDESAKKEEEKEEDLLVVDEYPPVFPKVATEKSAPILRFMLLSCKPHHRKQNVENSEMHTRTETPTAPICSSRKKIMYVQTNFGYKTHICKHCNFRTRQRSQIRKHQCGIFNSIDAAETQNKQVSHDKITRKRRRNKKKCELCAFTTINKRDFMQHKRLHNRDKPFQCTKCVFSVNTKASLTKHYCRYHQNDDSI